MLLALIILFFVFATSLMEHLRRDDIGDFLADHVQKSVVALDL